MRAHHDVHIAGFQMGDGIADGPRAAKTAQKLALDGKSLHAAQDRVVMLPRQQGGGCQQGALLAAHHTLKGGAQSHLGFAHAHIAAQQAVHRPGLLHIVLDLAGAAQLVGGFIVGKAGLKIVLPIVIAGKSIALGLVALGVQRDQLFGHFGGGGFYLAAGLGPFLPAQAAELDGFFAVVLARGAVAAQKVQLGNGHIQHIALVVVDLQIILHNALQVNALDALIQADAVVLVYHIVAGLDVRKAGQRVLGLFGRAALALSVGLAAACDQRIACKGILAAAGHLPGQHIHKAGRSHGIPGAGGRKAAVGQILGQCGGRTRGSGQHGYGIALPGEALQVLGKGRKLTAPAGQGVGGGIHDLFQLYIRHTAGEVFAGNAGALLRGLQQHGFLGPKLGQIAGERAAFQKTAHLFPAAELGGAVCIANAGKLIQHQNGIVKMVDQQAGGRVTHRVVFIHGLGHQPAVQRGKIHLHHLGQLFFFGTPALGKKLAQGTGRLGGIAEQNLARRADEDLFQIFIAALGEQIKAANGVDLIVPIFNAGGLAHIGGKQVHNAAAHAELARALYLVAPVIACAVQPCNQLLRGDHGAGLQREGVGAKILARHGVLQKSLGGQAHGLQPPAGQIAQHGQAAVFVFAARALNGAQHQIPGGKHGCGDAQRVQIGGKARGLGLAGGHHAQRAAGVTSKRCQHLGAACRGQPKKSRRARGVCPGKQSLVFAGFCKKCLFHGRSFQTENDSLRPAPEKSAQGRG